MRKDTDLKIIDFSLIVNNPHRKRVAYKELYKEDAKVIDERNSNVTFILNILLIKRKSAIRLSVIASKTWQSHMKWIKSVTVGSVGT